MIKEALVRDNIVSSHWAGVEPFTRPFSWLTFFSPLNLVGFLSGYGSCRCGNTFRRHDRTMSVSKPFPEGVSSGWLICSTCYALNETKVLRREFEVYEASHMFSVGVVGHEAYVRGMIFDEFLRRNSGRVKERMEQ